MSGAHFEFIYPLTATHIVAGLKPINQRTTYLIKVAYLGGFVDVYNFYFSGDFIFPILIRSPLLILISKKWIGGYDILFPYYSSLLVAKTFVIIPHRF